MVKSRIRSQSLPGSRPFAVETLQAHDGDRDCEGVRSLVLRTHRPSPFRGLRSESVNSKDHTTLVAAVKAAGLLDTLNGSGPFTVFAPTNEAFAALPAGTVDTLVKPEHKADLTKILTYHVVPGIHTAKQLMAEAKMHGGMIKLKTVQGEDLTVKLHDGKLWLVDTKGGKAAVTIADVLPSNGVIHVVDTVLMPK